MIAVRAMPQVEKDLNENRIMAFSRYANPFTRWNHLIGQTLVRQSRRQSLPKLTWRVTTAATAPYRAAVFLAKIGLCG